MVVQIERALDFKPALIKDKHPTPTSKRYKTSGSCTWVTRDSILSIKTSARAKNFTSVFFSLTALAILASAEALANWVSLVALAPQPNTKESRTKSLLFIMAHLDTELANVLHKNRAQHIPVLLLTFAAR